MESLIIDGQEIHRKVIRNGIVYEHPEGNEIGRAFYEIHEISWIVHFPDIGYTKSVSSEEAYSVAERYANLYVKA